MLAQLDLETVTTLSQIILHEEEVRRGSRDSVQDQTWTQHKTEDEH